MKELKITAFINQGYEIKEKELIAHTREHLAGYKTPKQILFVPEIIRATNGKADYKWANEKAKKELN